MGGKKKKKLFSRKFFSAKRGQKGGRIVRWGGGESSQNEENPVHRSMNEREPRNSLGARTKSSFFFCPKTCLKGWGEKGIIVPY